MEGTKKRSVESIIRRGASVNQHAANKLFLALQKYSDMDDEVRYALRNEFSTYEQLRYMNMVVVASVIVFMRQFDISDSLDEFTEENMRPFILKLMPTSDEQHRKRLTKEDLELIYIRLQVTFLRYAYLIILYRTGEID